MRATDKILINTKSDFIILSIISIFALLSRLPYINRGLVRDEMDTVFYAVETNSVLQTLSSSVSFNNHIGYSISARLTEVLLGHSEWAFRLPALVLGIASIPAFYYFSRLFFDRVFSLLGTVLFTVSPINLLWGTTGRGYSGMIFFTLVSSFLYLRLIKGPVKRRDTILYIIASTLSIYFHLYSIFIVSIQFIYLLYLRLRNLNSENSKFFVSIQSFKNLLTALVCIAFLSLILYIPAIPNLFHDIIVRGKSSFDPLFPWYVIKELSGSQGSLFTVLILVFSIYGIITFGRTHVGESLYFCLLLGFPLIIMWILRPFDLYPRFFAYWLPYLLLFFIAGLSSVWRSSIGDTQKVSQVFRSLLVLFPITAVILYWMVNWNAWIPQEGFRDASQAIVLGSDSSVAFCALGGDPDVFQYYFDQPIYIPQSLTDFLDLSKRYSEVRCVYYPASWQLPEHTQIAQFLKENGTWTQIKNVLLFTYRK